MVELKPFGFYFYSNELLWKYKDTSNVIIIFHFKCKHQVLKMSHYYYILPVTMYLGDCRYFFTT